MKILDYDQGTPQWHAWRACGLGGSDIACIMGMNPYKTAFQLWEEKMGLRDGAFTNSAMQRGHDYEEEAREWIEDSLDLPLCPPVCIQDDEFSFMKASLDGYCPEEDLIIEIKVPTERTMARFVMEDYFEKYRCQVQWQLMISGCHKAIFAVYSPEEARAHHEEVSRDEPFIEELKEAATKFWGDYLEGKPPSLSNKDYEEVIDEDLMLHCEEYKRIHAQLKDYLSQAKPLEDELKSLKSKITELGNDGNFRAYGISCSRSSPKVSYDIKAMEADGIPVSNYKRFKNEIGHYTLRVSKK